MNRFIMVSFKYVESLYYSLIRVKETITHKEYYITVMNGQLEKILHGNHILKEVDGSLLLELTDNKEVNMIKERIAGALSQMLQISVKEVHISKELS